VCGAALAFGASLRTQRFERWKLILGWTRSEELEKLRIHAYRELWRCLGGISTFNTAEKIVASLPAVQARLQGWYYDDGGGLFLKGSAKHRDSTKASFFAARDLRCKDALEIWKVFHQLRQSVRHELGIFESPLEEQAHVASVKEKLEVH